MTMVSNASGSVGNRSFWYGLQVQANVVGALLMRELHTRYGRENVGYLWIFLEPMTLAAAVALLHVGGNSHENGIGPVPFSILGYTTFIMFRGMVNRGEGALESNMPLFYHRRVTIFDMMFARALLEGAGTIVTYAVLIGFVMAIGMATLPARPLELLTGIGLIFWFSFAVSMLICAWTYENRLLARFVHPITYILMPLSGAFYQLAWIPEPYRSWFTWFPLPLIFELLRYGQFSTARDTYVDTPYVSGWCLLLTYVGLVSIRATRRRIHLR